MSRRATYLAAAGRVGRGPFAGWAVGKESSQSMRVPAFSFLRSEMVSVQIPFATFPWKDGPTFGGQLVI